MDTPRLSGSQGAYLFRRDQFLDGIAQRAASLFVDGYEVQANQEKHVFVVFCPEKKGTRPSYRVDLAQSTCTCPFYTRQGTEPLTNSELRVPCKHLVGLPALIHAQCREHVRTRRLGRYYRLWAHWRAASGHRPDLQAAWNALGPVCPQAATGTPLSHDDAPSPDGLLPRKETASCTGTMSRSA